MFLRKWMVQGLALVAGSVLAAQGALAAELVIYAKAEGPPKHYLDDEGQPKGYAIDIAVDAVQRAGYTPIVINLPWKRAQTESGQGGGVITAFSVTDERRETFLFTQPMYIDHVLLWQPREHPFAFEAFDDLVGKVIGIPRGSRYSGDFETIRSKLDLYEDSHHSNRLMMLKLGRLDAAIFSGDRASFKYHAAQAGLDPAEFTPAEKVISHDTNHIGVPLALKGFDPKEVRARLEIAISDMKADGTIEKILNLYR
ncbi:ABC transporter substrate-binding protein [Magnetospira sp. QH-2]|uniref:substrate-binding periplasmic protein n=1 Tax=Magnetospira sp. (strain QH-2) TaxID=1288970 RepID=UPI0003E818CD|nr:transporter substrate-binding domain-containing protein [Magnetospira sp. QH-2]CCQ72190.1 Extracellular solute-binding protein family 3 [Magnetospira sp. QH-2]